MINAELQRNLWLKFSVNRLVAIPVLLGIIFWISALSTDPASQLASVAQLFFMLSTWFVGAQHASASIMQEISEHTWDQQRMSALTPWGMAWGKLFGSTSLVWYVGLICLPVYVFASLNMQIPPGEIALKIASLLVVAILMQATGLLYGIHGNALAYKNASAAIGILFLISGLPLVSLWLSNKTLFGNDATELSWWGIIWTATWFQLYSFLFFAVCAVFAVWRAMCQTLQVRTTPWAWPLFACLLAGYLAGFPESEQADPLLWRILLVSMTMTYMALLAERNDVVTWRRVWVRAVNRQWRRMFEQLPPWPTTLLLGIAAAGILTATGSRPAGGIGEIHNIGFSSFFALILILMLIRDACMMMFFAFGPKPTRAPLSFFVYLILINGLLPLLAKASDNPTAFTCLLPIADPQWLGLLSIIAHVIIAAVLFSWRASKAFSIEKNG